MSAPALRERFIGKAGPGDACQAPLPRPTRHHAVPQVTARCPGSSARAPARAVRAGSVTLAPTMI